MVETINDINLEEKISTKEVSEQERRARLNEKRREQNNAIAKAEKDEKVAYGFDNNSINEMVIETKKDIEGIIRLYKLREGSVENIPKMSSIKKTTYDVFYKFGIDLYDREAKVLLNKAKKNSKELILEVGKLETALNSEKKGREGAIVLLDKENSMAENYANAIITSKNLLGEYKIQKAGVEEELRKLNKNTTDTNSIEYSEKKELIERELGQIKKEVEGTKKDIGRMSYKLKTSDKMVTFRKRETTSLSQAYNTLSELSEDLKNRIYGVGVYVGFKNKQIELVQLLPKMQVGLGLIGVLDEMETSLGEGTEMVFSSIDDKMNQYKSEEGPKEYEKRMQERTNKTQNLITNQVEEMIGKYATISCK